MPREFRAPDWDTYQMDYHTPHKALEPLTPQSCLPCHTEGKSPHFDPATYMPRVVHRAPAG